MEIGKLVVALAVNAKNYAKGLAAAKKDSLSFGKVAAKAAKAAAAGFVAAFAASIKVAKESIALAGIQQQAEAQLAATIKSTGSAAGLTANELKDMASALQEVTTFGDEAIIGAESLLLTFTNIGKDVFPDALGTILDMSQALGQDLKSSTVQLGKALNDPIAGISALSKVGVSFTQQQKDMIASMVELGDVAGAQQVILAELNKEFGGSAAAAAGTYDGQMQQLSNTMGDLMEQVGFALIPALTDFAGILKSDIVPALTDFIEVVGPKLSQAANDSLPAVKALLGGMGSEVEEITKTQEAAAQGMEDYIAEAQRIEEVKKIWGGFGPLLTGTSDDVDRAMSRVKNAMIESADTAEEFVSAYVEGFGQVGTSQRIMLEEMFRTQKATNAATEALEEQAGEAERLAEQHERVAEQTKEVTDLDQQLVIFANMATVSQEDLSLSSFELATNNTRLANAIESTVSATQDAIFTAAELAAQQDAETESAQRFADAQRDSKQALIELKAAKEAAFGGDLLAALNDDTAATIDWGKSLFDTAAAEGMTATQTVLLNAAVGAYSEEALVAALKTAAMQAKIAELGAALGSGAISVDQAVAEMAAFEAQLDASATSAEDLAGAIDSPSSALNTLGESATTAKDAVLAMNIGEAAGEMSALADATTPAGASLAFMATSANAAKEGLLGIEMDDAAKKAENLAGTIPIVSSSFESLADKAQIASDKINNIPTQIDVTVDITTTGGGEGTGGAGGGGGGEAEMAAGGLVRGGIPNRDSVPALLMPGEFVLPANIVDMVGVARLNSLIGSPSSIGGASTAGVSAASGSVSGSSAAAGSGSIVIENMTMDFRGVDGASADKIGRIVDEKLSRKGIRTDIVRRTR